jgi:large subunit ribosomal protein L24
MLVCPKCNAATRVGFSRKDGKVTRICKKCHAEIDA